MKGSLILLLALWMGAAAAQTIDGGAYFSPITDNVQPLIYGNTFSKSYLEGRQTSDTRRKPTTAGNPRHSPAPLPESLPADITVQFDPATSAAVRQEYIADLARSIGERVAHGLDRYYRTNNIRSLLARAATPYRLRTDELGDITTAYLVAMWMTANDAPPPTRDQVQGLRRQVRHLLASGNTVPADAAQRQRMAESLMYQTVTLLRLRETAQAQRNQTYLTQLADSAQDTMTRQKFNMRGLRMTNAGLVPR